MATKNEISQRILTAKNGAQDSVRKDFLSELANYTGRDTILYCSAYTTPQQTGVPSEALSLVTGDMQGFMSALHGLHNQNLDLIIHSPGGSVEAAEQVISYLRTKYTHIRAIIPQNAMSAATMLACACDEIIMGKHSAIGPIDPQITFPMQNGQLFTAPAHSILSEFEKAKREILANPGFAPLRIPKVSSWPPAILDICEQTIELAKTKVENWLESYMFVGQADAHAKARNIADWLGTYSNHLTHGRPIPIAVAQDKGLIVTALEDDQNLQEKVLSVFHAAVVTFEVTNCVKIIENQHGVGTYITVKR